MADSVVSSPYRWAARFLNWRGPVLALRQAHRALSRQINGHNAMNNLVHADSSFPAWLTLSSVWEESMDDREETKMTIGRNLRRLRDKRQLSRRSLAKLAEAGPFALREIEDGRLLPTIGLIWRLAAVLEVDCAAFLERPAAPR
ncbi:MAG TPA: helix-turn-helix transcriptional regulator [Verrucomicrobiae bacterium]|nr:helix-turn-helix transcriptional regulator [Verrucomicrobiae bacterium]